MLKISFAPPSISQGDVKIKKFSFKINSGHSIAIKPNAEVMQKLNTNINENTKYANWKIIVYIYFKLRHLNCYIRYYFHF